MHVARPPAFEHVKSGDSLMLWHPDALNTATLMAHPADPTYSSLIFREGPCNDVTLRDIGRREPSMKLGMEKLF